MGQGRGRVGRRLPVLCAAEGEVRLTTNSMVGYFQCQQAEGSLPWYATMSRYGQRDPTLSLAEMPKI
jgi:hypothetical protein